MNLLHRIILPAIVSILLILGLSTPSNGQAVDPSWYSTTLLQPAIEKAVANAIPQMPFRQETAANVIVEPLRYRYTKPDAPVSVSFGPGSKTLFTVEWTINVHTDNGRQFIIPSDRLESIFRQKYKPCGILPIVPGQLPFGPASCVAMKSEGQEAAGVQGRAAAWKLKDGYPKPNEIFQNRMKSNPTNSMSPGGFVIVEKNYVHTFSFSPPPAILEFGKTYEVMLRGVSVVPDDSPGCAGPAMIYVDAPTKSVHDGKLVGSKRENSSYYVIPPCQHINWVNNDPSQKQNWANYDKLTFEFRPSSELKEFRVTFNPIFGYREIAAEYLYVPIDNGSEPTFGGEFTGNAAAYDMGSCADIYVTVGLETTLPQGIQVNTQDNINQIGEAAKKWAVDIAAQLRAAIGPVCKNPAPTPTPAITPTPTPSPTPSPSPSPSPTPTPTPTPTPAQVGMRKLLTYYNYQHHDSETFSSEDAMRRAAAAGYQFSGDAGGFVYSEQIPGTVPLKLFYNESRQDYLTVATPDGERAALDWNYRFVRIEGYIFSIYQPLTVPLKLFWNSDRNDNLTIATPEGETGALNSGYGLVRIEGYIPKSAPTEKPACGLGVRWDEYEDGWTGTWIRRGNGKIFDSAWTHPNGQRSTAVMSIDVSGNEVFVERTQPNLGSCYYAGRIGSDGTSVTGFYTCDWWKTPGRTEWRASIRCN